MVGEDEKMIKKILQKAWEFLQHPVETFRISKDDRFTEVLTYYLILFFLDIVLTLVFSSGDLVMLAKRGFPNVGGTIDPFMFFLIIFGNDLFRTLFLGTLGLLTGGILIHIGVYLTGGRKGMKKTFMALMYGLTPYLVTSWITSLVSQVGIGGDIIAFSGVVIIVGWTIVVIFYGVRELQEISSERAGVVVAVPLVVLPFIAVVLFTLVVLLSWGQGMVYSREMMAPPIKFSLDRNGDTITLKNLGLRTVNQIRLDEISRLEVRLNGVLNGTIGTATGSERTFFAPSCPAKVAIIAVFTNGTRREITTIKDECINNFTNITMKKSGKTVTVRNNGAPRLGEVAELWVKSGLQANQSLGTAPGSEISWTDNTKSCSFQVTVDAHLKNGRTWRIVDEEVDTSVPWGPIRSCN